MRYTTGFKAHLLIAMILSTLLPLKLIASPLPTPSQTDQKINSIAAIVNDKIITRQELNQAIQITKQQIKHSTMPSPSADVIKKNVLQQLIYQQLQLQIAEQYGVSASNTEVTQAMNRLAQQQHVSLATLMTHAEQDGLSHSAFREKIKNEIIINKLQQQVISPKVNLSTSDLSEARRQLAKQSSHQLQYHIVDILIPLSSSATKEDKKSAKIKAQTIKNQLQSGTAASTLNSVEVNDLGWSNISNLPNLFTQALAKLPIKGVAGPLDAANGIHVIQLLGKKGSSSISDDEIHNLAFQMEFNQALAQWLKELKSNAYVKIY